MDRWSEFWSRLSVAAVGIVLFFSVVMGVYRTINPAEPKNQNILWAELGVRPLFEGIFWLLFSIPLFYVFVLLYRKYRRDNGGSQ